MSRLHGMDIGEQYLADLPKSPGLPGAYTWTHERDKAHQFSTEKLAIAAYTNKHGNAKVVPA